MEINPLYHLVLSSSLEMLHSKLAVCLATTVVELHLVAASVPDMSYL
jgi:hypothetical protein